MVTDPIADLLTRIRNAYHGRKERVDVPQSKIKVRIADILKQEGYIADYRTISDKKQGIIELKLRYDSENRPLIRELKRISRPGMRRYLGHTDIPKIKDGHGILILTTSKGVMTDAQARKEGVGGEALCTVW